MKIDQKKEANVVIYVGFQVWREVDLNHRHGAYETPALAA